MNKTAIFKNRLFLEHDPGYGHPESPDRLAAIYEVFDNAALAEKFLFPACNPADLQTIELNHTSQYVARVAATSGNTFDTLDPDTHTSPQSFNAACLAVGAVVEGVKMLNDKQIDNGFALVRPPGHHAEADRSSGFCLFNNIAVAAHYALEKLGLDRVLIVDWDLHHGNGTQHSFYDTDRVLYFSTHQYPYFPGTGAMHETGTGKGEGFTINVPLRGGQDDRSFAAFFNELLVPIARQYKPQMILVSAGYDIYHGDPLGLMAVTPVGFAYMTRVLMDLARQFCAGKILLTLEGGYNLKGLRDGVMATLDELVGNGAKHDKDIAVLSKQKTGAMIIEEVRSIAKKYWTL